MNEDTPQAALLRTHLSLTVPLQLMEYRAKGGPTEADWQRVRGFGIKLAAEGDQLLYRGKPGAAAALVTSLADALAVLSYQPGGVTIFGSHWETKLEGAEALEAWEWEQEQRRSRDGQVSGA